MTKEHEKGAIIKIEINKNKLKYENKQTKTIKQFFLQNFNEVEFNCVTLLQNKT